MKKYSIELSENTNCSCQICFRLGRVAKIQYYTQNYGSNKRKGKICKTLQKHPHSIWICEKCLNDFKSEWIRTTRGLGFDYYTFYSAEGKYKAAEPWRGEEHGTDI